MEGPICLIENRDDGKLKVNPEALGILSKFNNPAVVVCIVGMYRTGKSYLMNRLAGARTGFSLGSTIQSKTKGIWMWCVPHPVMQDHTLVLLDTEGLGDVEKGDKQNDIMLFTLAVLLSSTLVYNSKGTIDQDALMKLKFVGELSELVKVNLKNNEDEEAEFSRHFPSFIWAVRDFQLELKIDGKSVSEDEYLQNALKPKIPEKTIRDEEYNKVRKRLRMYFGSRKCFVFDVPTTNKELFQKLEEISDSDLSEEFVAQSKKFCDYVIHNAEVKTVKDTIRVTGRRLGDLAMLYTKALDSSKPACMEEAVVSLSEKENQLAVQDSVQHYESKMEGVVLPTDTLDQFLEVSRKCEEEAGQMFMKRSIMDTDQRFLKEFLEKINVKKQKFSALNEQKSREVCEALIKKLFTDLERSLTEGVYYKPGGHGKYKEDIQRLEIKYSQENGKGVKAEEVLKAFLESQEGTEALIIKQDNALTQREKEIEEENARKAKEEMERKIREMKEAREAQKLAEERANLNKTLEQLKLKMEEEREAMKEKLESTIRQKEKELELYLQQGLKQQAKMFQEQIADLKRRIEEQRSPNIFNAIVESVVTYFSRGLIRL